MAGSPLLVLLALLAPTPDPATAPAPDTTESSAPDATPSEPDATPPGPEAEVDRDYAGPTSVEAPPNQPLPEVVGDEPEPPPTDPAPGKVTAEPSSSAEGSSSATATIDPTPPPPLVVPPIKKRRPVPRVLSTITGNPEDETATLGTGRVRFEPGVQIRNQVGKVSSFTLDRNGEIYDESAFSTGRFRWNPRLHFGRVLSVVGTLDLINGRWAPVGSTNPIVDEIIEEGQPPGRTELRLADPRELYLQLLTPLGLLRVGQQSFTWGQGMLANSGNYVDRFGDMRFGDDGNGDIYERILFVTKPFKYRAGRIKDLAIGIGGDMVFRDERVQLTRGDRAYQALFVLRYDSSKVAGNSLGAYAVYRTQEGIDDGDIYPNDEGLQVGAFDIAGQGTLWLRDQFQLMGAFETALITGKAEFARDERGDHRVLQGGAVVRGYMGHHESWLVGLDAGYASGDPNPDDRFINNFTFDAGHTVGLIMFNPVMGWRSARSEILANDPQLTGIPSNGTQFIPTRGGLSNAIYIHPKARWALRERLELWGGPLLAAAPVPIVDPYAAQLNGGQPTNSLGGDGHRRFYGTELDLGIRGRVPLRDMWLQGGLQGAVLLPGPGMEDALGQTGGPIGAIWLRTELRY